MLLLARACGVQTADSKVASVGGRDVLLVRRLRPREGGGRLSPRPGC